MIERQRAADRPVTDRSWRCNIRKVGVIGAGQMGNGIAHVCALAGLRRACSTTCRRDRIKAGIATINGNMARQVSRKRITEDERKAALKRITPAADSCDAFGDCDLVIEAATEKEDVKRKIFAELCPSLKPEAHHRHQYVVDLDHPARRRRPTGRSASSASIS